MNLLLVEVWHAQRNVPAKYRCGSDWLSYSDALDGSLSRRGDYKLRCTLTTGVSQILYFTKLSLALSQSLDLCIRSRTSPQFH
jgi:hypothetical protein